MRSSAFHLSIAFLCLSCATEAGAAEPVPPTIQQQLDALARENAELRRTVETLADEVRAARDEARAAGAQAPAGAAPIAGAPRRRTALAGRRPPPAPRPLARRARRGRLVGRHQRPARAARGRRPRPAPARLHAAAGGALDGGRGRPVLHGRGAPGLLHRSRGRIALRARGGVRHHHEPALRAPRARRAARDGALLHRARPHQPPAPAPVGLDGPARREHALLRRRRLRAPGVRLGWLLPVPWFSEVHLGAQNANGETMLSFLASDEAFEERPIGGGPSPTSTCARRRTCSTWRAG